MRPLKVIITVKAKLTRVTIGHCRVQFTPNQHHIVSLMVTVLLKPEGQYFQLKKMQGAIFKKLVIDSMLDNEIFIPVRARIVKINRKNLLESSSTRQKRGRRPLRQLKPNLSKWQVILHPPLEDSSPAVVNSRWNLLQAVHLLLPHQLKQCLRQRQRVQSQQVSITKSITIFYQVTVWLLLHNQTNQTICCKFSNICSLFGDQNHQY